MIGYPLCVLLGLCLAALAWWWQPRSTTLPPGQAQTLRLGALAGAILGAYGLQLPADLLGFAAPLPAGALPVGDGLPLGGRTVLGGLLGGWLGVEGVKALAGIRQPTGGDFALPLALALGCGRIGCWFAGCCAGAPCAAGWFATVDAAGTPRLPVQLLEAAFHFAAAGLLAVAAQRRLWPTTRLAAYLASYAVGRFLIEFWRQHPPIALGLSWHQFLAVALFGLAGGTWFVRAARAARESV